MKSDKTYVDFLRRKALADPATGLKKIPPLNPKLFDFQKDIVAWALRRGRAAIFADCGLGKTLMQLEWAHHVPGRVLILAPLAVAQQTVSEGAKFGIDCIYSRDNATDAKIVITNYEMLQHFDVGDYSGVVLDESSILKAYDGKTRTHIIESFSETPWRLACTATPAPNDFMELGNHSEFLGAMTRPEMLAMFFTHDGGETQKWRVKKHAQDAFWRWICQWAVMLKKPSDLGYDDKGFDLPALTMKSIQVDDQTKAEGWLFPMEAQSLSERLQARKRTVTGRTEACAEIVRKTDGQVLIWCNLNAEADKLKKLLPGSVNVQGSDKIEAKTKALTDFVNGETRVLISKPTVCGFGMNFQNCHQVFFVGLSDSYEQFYQAVRRCWRFGQKKEVNVHIITAQTEGAVLKNIKAKEAKAADMNASMVKHMAAETRKELKGITRDIASYDPKIEMILPEFANGG